MKAPVPFFFEKLSSGIKQVQTLFIVIMTGILIIIFNSQNFAIPSFARQTNLSCNYCHYTFPALNSFGRMFKLNGYTMNNTETIEAVSPDSGRTTLKLLNSLPLSAMVMTSFSSVNKAQPGAESSFAQLPQQISFFLSGEIAPHIGTYLQFTYDPSGGTFGLDMVDLRYANHTSLGSNDLLYGFTLNNNPSMQDVWNTTPIWGFPYASSGAAPSPSASTLLQSAPGNEAGLGAYALYDKLLYAEISLYHSAPQGAAYPPDSTWAGNIKGVSPYWRVALQHQWTSQYLEIGTFGLSSEIYPLGITGQTDKFTDIGFDAQYENSFDNGGTLILHTSYITEKQNLDATFNAGGSANASNTLNSFKIDAGYNFPDFAELSAGFFSTSGSSDGVIYAANPVTGSNNSTPNSSGEVLQLTFIPWLNTQFALQYTMYSQFNGGSTNYDGSGRNASDNNTLYFLAWFVF
ncbi:MAG: cytochrome C [Ignavibacteriaceae bacterium]